MTQDISHAKTLCDSEILKIFITENKSKIISHGETLPFRLFSCEMKEKDSGTETMEIPMFFNHQHFLNFKFVAGITRDHMVNPRKMKFNIQKYNSTYMPEDSYFTPDPLPVGWMELFHSKYREDITSPLRSSSEEIANVYSPILNQEAIFSSPKTSGKILHIGVNLD